LREEILLFFSLKITRMREELEKANEFLNEEDKKKKEYFILS